MNPYQEGWNAYESDMSEDDNPYSFETQFAHAENWLNGFVDAEMNHRG